MNDRSNAHYDYIITGGGAAGLSLLYSLLHSSLKDRRILVLDKATKTQNDRTWCFWEKTPGPFEHIVFHRWQRLWFHQAGFSKLLDIAPYTYKVIRGIDFYRETERVAAQFPNVERRHAGVDAIRNTDTGVAVTTDDGSRYTADWCFNSIFFGKVEKEKVHYLDQHFRGWFIRTQGDVFDTGQATLMDFRTPQHGETRFLYVLPFSAREALVEVAIFSNQHLQRAEYDAILERYMAEHLAYSGDYEITDTEQGNIPMTDYAFPTSEGRIVHLGMVGGDTRASTGYTFWNIQQRVERVVQQLENRGNPLPPEPFAQQRARRYDTLLLHVLEKGLYPGDALFGRLFERNPPARILAFLNAESNLAEEVQLMHTTPVSRFLRALAEVSRRWAVRQ